MKSFSDNTGRTWVLTVNVGTIKRVRALCGVDLANIISIRSGSSPPSRKRGGALSGSRPQA